MNKIVPSLAPKVGYRLTFKYWIVHHLCCLEPKDCICDQAGVGVSNLHDLLEKDWVKTQLVDGATQLILFRIVMIFTHEQYTSNCQDGVDQDNVYSRGQRACSQSETSMRRATWSL